MSRNNVDVVGSIPNGNVNFLSVCSNVVSSIPTQIMESVMVELLLICQ